MDKIPVEVLTDRRQRARQRAATMNVRLSKVEPGYFIAQSQTVDDVIYDVRRVDGQWRCNCPGFTFHGACKHAAAAELRAERESPVTREMIETLAATFAGKAA